MPLDELIENALERDAVQRITRMLRGRWHWEVSNSSAGKVRRRPLPSSPFEVEKRARPCGDGKAGNPPASPQDTRREVAGSVFGFSFFGFLISFF